MTEAEGEATPEFARSLLNEWLRIEIADGRVLLGRLLVTDNTPNIVLHSCSEYWQNNDGTFSDRRDLGSAVIPARHIKNISQLTKIDAPPPVEESVNADSTIEE